MRVTGDESQGTMERVQTAGDARCLLPAFLGAHIERETSGYEAARFQSPSSVVAEVHHDRPQQALILIQID